MNRNSAVQDKVRNLEKFIMAVEKIFSLCKMLLQVKSATKILKGEDIDMPPGLIEYSENVIKNFKLLVEVFKIGMETDDNHLKVIEERKIKVVGLIKYLQKKTNVLRGDQVIYEFDILQNLDKATIKFLEIAD